MYGSENGCRPSTQNIPVDSEEYSLTFLSLFTHTHTHTPLSCPNEGLSSSGELAPDGNNGRLQGGGGGGTWTSRAGGNLGEKVSGGTGGKRPSDLCIRFDASSRKVRLSTGIRFSDGSLADGNSGFGGSLGGRGARGRFEFLDSWGSLRCKMG